MRKETFTKDELIEILSDIKIGNWILTGFTGNKKEAKKSIAKNLRVFTVEELRTKIENITAVEGL